MLAPFPLLLGTVTVAVWSLWRRRATWRNRWDRATNLVIVLAAVAMFTSDNILGMWTLNPLHRLLGIWSVEDVVSDCAMIAAASMACHMFIYRVLPPRYARACMNRWVIAPGIFGATVLVVTFVHGRGFAAETTLLYAVADMDPWLTLYRMVVAFSVAYLLGVATRVLLILRREPRHRPVADLYITACLLGIVISNIRFWSALSGVWVVPHLIYVGLIVTGFSAFCLGAVVSLERRKIAEVPIIKFVEPEPQQ